MEPELNETALKRLLLARVFALRRNQFTYESLDKAQSVQDDLITVDGAQVKRRRIVLTAHGCKVATCTMCPLPDEAVSPKTPVTLDHWMAQIRAAIGPDDDVHTLTLFHNGNYFSQREVPSDWRMVIHDYLRTQTRIKHLVVESLPQYINDGIMFETSLGLRVGRADGGIKLIVAIGLQSSSELVRELCIASTCLDNSFQRAIKSLRDFGFDAQVFLMFGAAFLDADEAAYDLKESVAYCHSLGIKPTVCPLQVAPNTLVADLVARGLWYPPRHGDLFSLLPALDQSVRVAISLFKPDDLWRAAFDRYNHDGRVLGWPGTPFPVTKPDRAKVLGRIRDYLASVDAIALDTPPQVGESGVS